MHSFQKLLRSGTQSWTFDTSIAAEICEELFANESSFVSRFSWECGKYSWMEVQVIMKLGNYVEDSILSLEPQPK